MFYKTSLSGYILSVSTGVGQTPITETEYNTILNAIKDKPEDKENIKYRLRDDMVWEEYYSPDPEPEASEEDYETALKRLGVNISDEE